VGAPQAQKRYLLLSSETHRVSGSGGCNRFTGSYEKNGDRLSFSKTAGTMMECPKSMDTEEAFLKALTRVTAWKITERQLKFLEATAK
jgi:heat shock protein HslJ